MTEPNRRNFVGMVAGGACACLFCSQATSALAKAEVVDVGPPADFAKDGIYDKFAPAKRFFIVRDKGRIFAVSATCTHKAFPVEKDGTRIACTKHGSLFDARGVVTKGPARQPLPRYGIRLGEGGHVFVDTGKTFAQKQWEQQGTFINV